MKIPLPLYLAATAAFMLACSPQPKTSLPKDDERIAVRAVALQADTLPDTLHASGALSTSSEARYSFKTGGVIAEMLVENGDAVRRGQLLARVRLDEIEAGLGQAQLGFDKAQRDLQRVERLYADSVATREQLQNATTARDLAQRQLEAVRFNRSLAEIRAEADGFVATRLANVGEVVGAGQPVLLLQHTGAADWVLKVALSDRDWVRLQMGAAAWVQLDAHPNQLLQGRVLRKQRSLQAFSGALTAEIKVLPGNLPLASGLFGRVSIPLSTGKSVYRLPYEALIEADGNEGFVFVPKGEGVEKRTVEVVSLQNNEVWVRSGLEGVSRVLVGNAPFLNEQSRIRISQ